jgi:hypothetical protein
LEGLNRRHQVTRTVFVALNSPVSLVMLSAEVCPMTVRAGTEPFVFPVVT